MGRPLRKVPSLHCIVAPEGGAAGASRTAAVARALAIAPGVGGVERAIGFTAGALTAAGRTESTGSTLERGIGATAAGVGVRCDAGSGAEATTDGGFADGGISSGRSAAAFGGGGGACCAPAAGPATARASVHATIKRLGPVLMVSPSLERRGSSSSSR